MCIYMYIVCTLYLIYSLILLFHNYKELVYWVVFPCGSLS